MARDFEVYAGVEEPDRNWTNSRRFVLRLEDVCPEK
jgi:hypothetical protein